MKGHVRRIGALVRLSLLELWRRNDMFALLVLALVLLVPLSLARPFGATGATRYFAFHRAWRWRAPVHERVFQPYDLSVAGKADIALRPPFRQVSGGGGCFLVGLGILLCAMDGLGRLTRRRMALGVSRPGICAARRVRGVGRGGSLVWLVPAHAVGQRDASGHSLPIDVFLRQTLAGVCRECVRTVERTDQGDVLGRPACGVL